VMQEYWGRWLADELVCGVLPEYGCIAFPKLAGIDDTQTFSTWLADKYGVIAVPGELFRAAGHVRIGFALAADELEQALSNFTAGLKEYRTLAPARQHMA